MVHKRHHKVKEYICNATCHLGDGQREIPRQIVRGSDRAIRDVRNTQVFLTEIRVVPVVPSCLQSCRPRSQPESHQSSLPKGHYREVVYVIFTQS